MRTQTLASLAGALLLTALLATRTYLPFSGHHAEPLAALITLSLLFVFGYAFFALFLRSMVRLPASWPTPLSWSVVVLAALVLALLLRFYQFLPALLVLGWCQAGLACGDVGNQAYNSLLSAGRGVVILMLLPAVTLPVLLVAFWLQRRGSKAAAPR
jgi:hypothetical protein